MNLTQTEISTLIEQALKARENAYCPFSHYPVGAAVLTNDSQIITGTNIEANSPNLGACAERMALFTAFTHGHRHIKALALVTEHGYTPCGTCRQVIYQLCCDIPIIIAKTDNTYIINFTLQLLPSPFDIRPCGSSIV